MIPLGISNFRRESSSTARVISLVPNKRSCNILMDTVIDNVVEVIVIGANGVHPNGRSVRIFLDMVSFLGYYPDAAAVSDVRLHMESEFLSLYAFFRRRGADSSKYLFSTTLHSHRLSRVRLDMMNDIFRNHGLSPS